jgi:predicted nucleic acid-binding protein
VLLRAFDAAFTEVEVIRRALRALVTRQERLVVTVQNLAEFWNVSTRPLDKNGYSISVERTARRLALIERVCDVLTEDEASYQTWRQLVQTHKVSGVAVHDARLMSVMLAQGVSTVVTLNERDFRRYPGISILTPDQI